MHKLLIMHTVVAEGKGSLHAQTLSQVEDFEPIFASRKKFLPKHSDLSFYNWDTNYSTSNSTPNYQVWPLTSTTVEPRLTATHE